MKKKFSIEPDDGFDSERDLEPRKTWEQWEEERNGYLSNTYPGLFEMLEVIDGKQNRPT